ncbi:MAG: acyl carrier protein [Chitinivibrionales bacterium]|nr:acyl carrier protein [Chitinivibrionales bacterium]
MHALIDELKVEIIQALKLSDCTVESIDENAPLVGAGLGLDSIDTLELLVLLEKKYGVTVPDIRTGREVFASVKAMAAYIEKNSSRLKDK